MRAVLGEIAHTVVALVLFAIVVLFVIQHVEPTTATPPQGAPPAVVKTLPTCPPGFALTAHSPYGKTCTSPTVVVTYRS